MKLTILEDYRSFNAGDTFVFEDGLNVIVGDNGAGKTTLLNMLKYDWYTLNTISRDYDMSDKFTIEGLDEYKHKWAYHPHYDSAYGTSMADMNTWLNLDGLQRKRLSSGQGSIYWINKIFKEIAEAPKEDKKLLIFDEPMMGMSVKNQFKMMDTFIAISKEYNCTIFCATHSYAALKLFSMSSKTAEVFDMTPDAREYISLNTYLTLQLNYKF